jgi:hypothetical protein
MATETEKEVKVERFLKSNLHKEHYHADYHQALRWFLGEFSDLLEEIDDFYSMRIEDGPGLWKLAHYATAQSIHGLMINQFSFTIKEWRDGRRACIEPICIAPYQESSNDCHGELLISFIIGYSKVTAFSGDEGAPYQVRGGKEKCFVLHNVSQPHKGVFFCPSNLSIGR